MFRLGVITDVHANLFALAAALRELRRHRVQQLVHCGDAVDFGPHPQAVLETLREHGVLCVSGNHDELLSAEIPPDFALAIREHVHWTRQQVDAELAAWVRAWPAQLTWRAGAVSIVATHYGTVTRQDGGRTAVSLADTPDRDDAHALDGVFRELTAPPGSLVLHGHSHRPTDVRGRLHYVSPGPCGLNLTGAGVAPCLVLEVAGEGPVELRRYEPTYDAAAFAASLAGLPGGGEVLRKFHPSLALHGG